MKTLALLLSLIAAPAWAQHAGAPTVAGRSSADPADVPADADAKTDAMSQAHHASTTASRDAGARGHAGMPPPAAAADPDASTHAAADTAPDASKHAMAGHSAMPMRPPSQAVPDAPLRAPTDADRAAAFPPVAGHAMHDRARHGVLRVERLERDDDDGLGGEFTAWYGGDVRRVWLRAQADGADGRVRGGDVELLAGRMVAPWWDVVGGVREDVGDGPSRTWAAFGVQGFAPYKFDVRATVYVGGGGRTAARVDAGYDTLLTNRFILQWRTEAEAYGRADPARRIGAGLATVEAGVRLRYEITRRFAPYLGIEHERAFGGTAAARRGDADGTRVVAGLRLIF